MCCGDVSLDDRSNCIQLRHLYKLLRFWWADVEISRDLLISQLLKTSLLSKFLCQLNLAPTNLELPAFLRSLHAWKTKETDLEKEASMGEILHWLSSSVRRSPHRSEACELPAALKYLLEELCRDQHGREGKQMAATGFYCRQFGWSPMSNERLKLRLERWKKSWGQRRMCGCLFFYWLPGNRQGGGVG